MIVIGDISGIHDFVFAVPQTGGGQARRLRARSFLLQAAAECAALAVQRKLAWPDESLLFAAASKFALQGPDDPQAEQSLIALRSEIQKALFDLSGGILRFSLAWSAGGNPTEQYANAERRLRILKQKPMAQNALDDGRWNPSRLILEPLDHPCELCQRRSASTTVRLRDGQTFIMGGLQQEESREVRSRIPILSDLPIIGGIFKSKHIEKTNVDLTIFVTARLLSRTGHLPEEEEREIKERFLGEGNGQ